MMYKTMKFIHAIVLLLPVLAHAGVTTFPVIPSATDPDIKRPRHYPLVPRRRNVRTALMLILS